MEFLKREIISMVSDGFLRVFCLMYSLAPLIARSSTVVPGNTSASTAGILRRSPARSSSTPSHTRRITPLLIFRVSEEVRERGGEKAGVFLLPLYPSPPRLVSLGVALPSHAGRAALLQRQVPI